MASLPTDSNHAASMESMIDSPKQSPKHYGATGWSMPPSRSDLIDSGTARPRRHGDRFRRRAYQLQKPVALKLVRFPKEQSDARSRFEREMLAIGKLNHPSIVSATDAGQEGDLQYLVMELVRGMDLSQIAAAFQIWRSQTFLRDWKANRFGICLTRTLKVCAPRYQTIQRDVGRARCD